MSWILFVEDSEDLRFVVEASLQSFGYDVESAADGAEALTRLEQRETPFLIITDLHMPVMTGWELIAHVRSDTRLKHVPIVVASSEEEPVAGAEHHLAKPYRLSDLEQLVERYAVPRKATGTR